MAKTSSTPAAVEELPVVESITMQRTPKGWIVVILRSKGDRVVDKEIVCEPQAKVYASESLKIQVVNRFIREISRPESAGRGE